MPDKAIQSLWTTAQAAQRLRARPAFVRELARNGQLPHLKLGARQYRFDPKAIEQFIASGGQALADGRRQEPPDAS